MESILLFIAKLLQYVSNSSVNDTCFGPSYQPKEPEVLRRKLIFHERD